MTDQPRTASIARETGETRISLEINVDGTGQPQVATGVGFLDHMLTLFARHSLIDLSVEADGDLHVDFHHTVEDVGICLGQALRQAAGDKRGINRYGSCTLPMDETLVTAALDFSGRAYFAFGLSFPTAKVGDFDTELIREFWQAVSSNALLNLHLVQHAGANSHHIAEASFKSTARAVRQALARDPRQTGVPSSKGTLS